MSLQYHSFSTSVDKYIVMKKINNLQPNEASRDKLNCDFFAEHVCSPFHTAISSVTFPVSFNFADITLVFKNGSRIKNVTLDQQVS